MAQDKGYIRRPTNPQPKHPKQVEAERKVSDEELFHVHIPTDEEVVGKAKSFWEKYGKLLSLVLGVVILAIVGYISYKKFYKEPREEKANEAIFPAEKLFDAMSTAGFSKDSVNIAMNGGVIDGQNVKGLLKIIKEYSGTNAANRATYMAGASYLHIQKFDDAIKYLKEFDGNGASQVQSQANIMLGHAYAEKKQVSEALDYYKKAANASEKDEVIGAFALNIAARFAEKNGKTQEAVELFKKLKEKFPTSPAVSSGEVEKYLAKLGIVE